MTSARAAAAELGTFLGNPREPGGPFSYRETVAAEERNELPEGAIHAIRSWGFQEFLVPVEQGGRFGNLEELFCVTRTVAQRNLTVAVMFGSALLGANPVWLWGSDEQKKALAAEILRGRLTCFGVSEADHGSDLMSSATTVRHTGGHLVLSGAKWPVGNATRARFVTTFARAEEGRRFSLLLVDKAELPPGTWAQLPAVRTAGLRGHDLSGIVYDEAPIPASSVIGHEGTGLAQTLKALQITRTAIAALSIGTMDAAIRIALRYAHDRELYGRPVYDLPVIRDTLLKAHVDLLIGECVAVPVSRALSVAPSRLSLWSSVVKFFVPVLAEEVVASMAAVLGARGYLREGVADGIFQKLQRDHAIASVFEGTTHVNLHGVAHQLPHVLRRASREATAEEAAGRRRLLEAVFCMTRDAPRWEPDGSRLQLSNRGHDEITTGWDEAERHLGELAAAPDPLPVLPELRGLVGEFRERSTACWSSVTAERDWDSGSVRAQSVATEHAVYHAAASCLLTWQVNRKDLGGEFAAGGWLVLCLERLLQRLDPSRQLSAHHAAPLERVVLDSLEKDGEFSLHSFRI
ncbi:acyl-CoA dehydrogenase [Streptomyces sp. SB3404]|uniref:Acyl-CoA dehydrogenase n=2 Tax=Streptomyces boncukensis TaxID=2711219 RepID=A0A6G4WNV3_9ACTN|nr:acyl-CoA dehydrogenase [Streptomyces boncukensis]NGO66946.1 acyl-CoA dehydrogenase [Streptomyces boncukensis]